MTDDPILRQVLLDHALGEAGDLLAAYGALSARDRNYRSAIYASLMEVALTHLVHAVTFEPGKRERHLHAVKDL